jgi:rhodanese-related sulfurtransferase
MTAFQRLRPLEVPAWLDAHPNALVLDAREAAHHAQGHLAGSLRLDGRNHEGLLMREPKTRPVFIYCYRGNASQTYAQMFVDFGFKAVADLLGGWETWPKHPTPAPAAPTPAVAAPATPPAATALPHALPHALADWLQAQGLQDAHTPGEHGNTPLMRAAWRGETAIVEALLAQGVSLSAVNGDGNNALWLACVSNDPALVTRLAQAGVPIDHLNLTGATCLMYAASSSKPSIVRTLLSLGADPRIVTQDDYSALDMAADIDSLHLLRAAATQPPSSLRSRPPEGEQAVLGAARRTA